MKRAVSLPSRLSVLPAPAVVRRANASPGFPFRGAFHADVYMSYVSGLYVTLEPLSMILVDRYSGLDGSGGPRRRLVTDLGAVSQCLASPQPLKDLGALSKCLPSTAQRQRSRRRIQVPSPQPHPRSPQHLSPDGGGRKGEAPYPEEDGVCHKEHAARAYS